MDEAFYCRNGKVARNLDDLVAIMNEMEQDEYSHHVSEFKNDFANWILHVLDNASLAEEVKKCGTREETLARINEHLMRKRVTQRFEEFVAVPVKEAPPVVQEKSPKQAILPSPQVKAIDVMKKPEQAVTKAEHGEGKDKYKYFTLKEFILGVACGFVLGFVVSKLIFSLLLN
ncbi:MAG: DUF5752 family protein [Nanoarchaeota archaeon]